jgi:hypothetical protein
MIQNSPRFPLPVEIEREMSLWRKGLGDCIKFVAYHRKLAEEHLAELQDNYTIKVHNTYMDYDGAGDGVQFLHAIVETPKGKLMKLKWHDSNQGFMVKCEGGGWNAMFEQDIQ